MVHLDLMCSLWATRNLNYTSLKSVRAARGEKVLSQIMEGTLEQQ